jgi:hypothetical protein
LRGYLGCWRQQLAIAMLLEKETATMSLSGTPIALPLRAWFAVEVFFGVSAVLSIGLDPANTRTNFAWNVQPVVMAAVLGAYYISSALLFLLPLFARRWEMIRVMILPTALFSTAELITTVLHWSRFSIGTVQFTGWLLSYLLPPPIFVGYYFWQERRARRAASAMPAEPLAPDVRNALLHWGGVLAILTIFFFIVPQALIAIAPWPMTPLTARAFDSWLLAVAALMLSMAYENHRTRVLVGTPMLILVLPVVTIQIARYADQVQFANVALFVFYGITLIAFALGVYLARGDWRQALS